MIWINALLFTIWALLAGMTTAEWKEIIEIKTYLSAKEKKLDRMLKHTESHMKYFKAANENFKVVDGILRKCVDPKDIKKCLEEDM